MLFRLYYSRLSLLITSHTLEFLNSNSLLLLCLVLARYSFVKNLFLVDLQVVCMAMVLLRAEGINDNVAELIFINGTVLINFWVLFLVSLDKDLLLLLLSWAVTALGLLRLMMMLARLGENLPGQLELILDKLLADLLVRSPSRWELVVDLDN